MLTMEKNIAAEKLSSSEEFLKAVIDLFAFIIVSILSFSRYLELKQRPAPVSAQELAGEREALLTIPSLKVVSLLKYVYSVLYSL